MDTLFNPRPARAGDLQPTGSHPHGKGLLTSGSPVRVLSGELLDIGVSFGPQEKPLRTVSCLIESCFLVGFARDFGYVMCLRCAIVLRSRDGFEEMCFSICRVTRKPSSRTIRRLKILENSSESAFPGRSVKLCASIGRVTRRQSSWTKSLGENSKNSFDALNFRACSWRRVSYGLASEDQYVECRERNGHDVGWSGRQSSISSNH